MGLKKQKVLCRRGINHFVVESPALGHPLDGVWRLARIANLESIGAVKKSESSERELVPCTQHEIWEIVVIGEGPAG